MTKKANPQTMLHIQPMSRKAVDNSWTMATHVFTEMTVDLVVPRGLGREQKSTLRPPTNVPLRKDSVNIAATCKSMSITEQFPDSTSPNESVPVIKV